MKSGNDYDVYRADTDLPMEWGNVEKIVSVIVLDKFSSVTSQFARIQQKHATKSMCGLIDCSYPSDPEAYMFFGSIFTNFPMDFVTSKLPGGRVLCRLQSL